MTEYRQGKACEKCGNTERWARSGKLTCRNRCSDAKRAANVRYRRSPKGARVHNRHRHINRLKEDISALI